MNLKVEFLALVLEDFEYKYKGHNVESSADDDVRTKSSFRDYSYQKDENRLLLKCRADILIDASSFMLDIKAVGVGAVVLEKDLSLESLTELQLKNLFLSLADSLLAEANKRVNELLEHTYTAPNDFVDFFRKE